MKLAEAKKERQRLQEAASILENRILYLEKLSNKVQTKTQIARKKADELIRLKQKVKTDQQTVKEKIEKWELKQKEQQQRVSEMKASHGERLDKSKIELMSQCIAQAKLTKEGLEVM